MRALVRGVPDSYEAATREHFGEGQIDVAVARAQHATYCEALANAGCEVHMIPADSAFPDCCFVEDMAVVAGGVAMITHSGHPGRVGERVAVEAALGRWMPTVRMPDHAHLDGGDVLVCGDVILVGLTRRTDAEGVAFLEQTFGPRGFQIQAIEMPGLHLKCVVSKISRGVIGATRGSVAPGMSLGLRVVELPEEETYAANFVVVGNKAIVSAGYPRTAAILKAQGLALTAVPTTEFFKADGSLTCLSILFQV